MSNELVEAQVCVKEIKSELIEAYKNESLYVYLSNNVISVFRDSDNDIESVIFTNGNPFVYLDFTDRVGEIIYSTFDNPLVAKTAISWNIWDDIRDKIIDIYDVE